MVGSRWWALGVVGGGLGVVGWGSRGGGSPGGLGFRLLGGGAGEVWCRGWWGLGVVVIRRVVGV